MNDFPVLSCQGVCKSYGSTQVLNEFNLEVHGGRIFGLLGPNGCGKSTLLKLVTGLLVPNSGSIKICGEERSEKTNSYISFLPERTCFNSGMLVCELIMLYEDFFSDFNADMAREMLSTLGIPFDKKLKELSKGMKEKAQLAMAMSRQTKLYLLDEPIGGVDPASREYILNTIIGKYNKDAAVIITTHLISDIEPILDDFAFMSNGGKIIRQGNADQIRLATGQSIDELFRRDFRCYGNY